MHPFGNNCCRKKPFNLRVFKVGISGESRGGVPGDPHPLSLGLDDRPPPAPLSEGVDLPLAINVKLQINAEISRHYTTILLLQFGWLRAVVFHLNLKYLHVKITNLPRVVVYS